MCLIHPVHGETDLCVFRTKIASASESEIKLERLVNKQENETVIPSEPVRVRFDFPNCLPKLK